MTDGTMTGRPSLEAGLALHRAGRLREAAATYGQVLKADNRNPDALHLLGLVMHQLGDNRQAESLIGVAIALKPGAPHFRNNFGMVLRALGQSERAVVFFREAARLNPGYADAYANLGGLLPWQKQEDVARRALHRALVLEPAHDDAWGSLGALERVAANLDRGLTAHRRALTIRPTLAIRLLNLGSTLVEAERYDEARGYLVRAALLDPGMAEPWNDLGYRLLVRLQVDAADRSFRHAVEIRPAYGSAWAGRAEAAFASGDADLAARNSARAVEADPGNPQLRFRAGIHRLAAGDLAGGWADYDAQWKKASAVRRVAAPPRWTGDDLTGRTLLITADQGIGDELLFSSCVPDVVRAAGKVVLECDQRLVSLFRRSFPDVFVHPYDRGGTRARPIQRYGWIPSDWKPDAMIEAGALMRWFRPSVAALDAAADPWLAPDPDRVEAMRAELDRLGPGRKVGVSWRSMRLTEIRNIHYPGLAAFAPVLRVPGVTFVCLQYGTGWQEELRAAGVSMAVIPGLDTTADIDGVTALASLLDAVICPSSTLGWIAASVGVPNWLLYNTPVFLEFGTDRYPGFPTVRPYRKVQIEPWEPLMERLAGDLAEWAGQVPDEG